MVAQYKNAKGGAQATEAGQLFISAEEALTGSGDFDSAIRPARKALAIFTQLATPKGGKPAPSKATRDCVRLVVHASLAKVEMLRYVKTFMYKQDVKETLEEAQALVTSHLEGCRANGDRRSEGAMLLSGAEISAQRGGADERQAALKAVEEARALFNDAKDVVPGEDGRLEGLACCLESDVHYASKAWSQALQSAQTAQGLFSKLGDKVLEARAWHRVAMAFAASNDFNSSLDAAMEALSIFRDLELRRLEAYELQSIAEWQLVRERPKEVMPAAKEALAIFEESGYDKIWQGGALRILVDAHLMRFDAASALRVSNHWLEIFRNKGDKRMITMTYDLLAQAHLSRGELTEASECVETAMKGARALGNNEWVAGGLKTSAEVNLHLGWLQAALDSMFEAITMYQKLGDAIEEAKARLQMSDLYVKCGGYESALSEANSAMKIFKKQNDRFGHASALVSVATVHQAMDNLQDALTEATEAAEMCQQDSNMLGEANALALVADIRMLSNDAPGALEAAKRRTSILRDSGLFKMAASSNQLLAEMHLVNQEPEAAVRVAWEGQTACRRAEDRIGEANALITVMRASTALLVGESLKPSSRAWINYMEKALQAGKDALNIAAKLNNKHIHGVVYYWFAHVAAVAGDSKEALNMAKESVDLLKEASIPAEHAKALVLVGEVNAMLGEKQAAKEAVLEGLQILQAHKDKEGEQKARKVLQSLGVVLGGAAVQQQVLMDLGADAAAAPSPGAAEAAVAPSKGLDPDAVQKKILELAAQVVSDEDEIGVDTPLMDMGLDSLNAVQFRNDLAKTFDLALPASLIFDYPTIGDLTRLVMEQHAENA